MSDFQISTKRIAPTSDILGALASFICLVHCLATPFLFLAHSHAHSHAEAHHEAGPLWWGLIDYLFLLYFFYCN